MEDREPLCRTTQGEVANGHIPNVERCHSLMWGEILYETLILWKDLRVLVGCMEDTEEEDCAIWMEKVIAGWQAAKKTRAEIEHKIVTCVPSARSDELEEADWLGAEIFGRLFGTRAQPQNQGRPKNWWEVIKEPGTERSEDRCRVG